MGRVWLSVKMTFDITLDFLIIHIGELMANVSGQRDTSRSRLQESDYAWLLIITGQMKRSRDDVGVTGDTPESIKFQRGRMCRLTV